MYVATFRDLYSKVVSEFSFMKCRDLSNLYHVSSHELALDLPTHECISNVRHPAVIFTHLYLRCVPAACSVGSYQMLHSPPNFTVWLESSRDEVQSWPLFTAHLHMWIYVYITYMNSKVRCFHSHTYNNNNYNYTSGCRVIMLKSYTSLIIYNQL